MYRINKRIVMGTAPSFTSVAGNIRSTLLGGNNSTNNYVITDKLDQRLVGQTFMFDMNTPILNPGIHGFSKGVLFKVLNVSRIWYEDNEGVIKEGGRYELERDDVSTALHMLSANNPADTSTSYKQRLSVILTQAPTTFLRKYPNSYTASKLALGSKLLSQGNQPGGTIKLLITDGSSSEARTLANSNIGTVANDSSRLIRTMSEIATGEIKASNVRIRIGFSEDEVNSIMSKFVQASSYKTLHDRVMYETGKMFFSIGSSTLTINTCDDSGFVSVGDGYYTGNVGASGEFNIIDDAGFVRRWMYNGTLYDFPVIDIAPVATGYEDEMFKINQLSDLTQGDIVAALVSLITDMVGGLGMASPAMGGIAGALRNIELVPPEYKASFSYAMFQMSGLKSLGNSVLSMKNKERDGSTLFNDIRPMYGYSYVTMPSVLPVQQLSTSDYQDLRTAVSSGGAGTKSGNTLYEMYDAMKLGELFDNSNRLEFIGYIRDYIKMGVDLPEQLYEPLNDFLKSGFSFVID